MTTFAFTDSIVETPEYRISTPQPISGKLSAFPDIVTDGSDRAWMTWVETVDGCEQILAAAISETEPLSPLSLSDVPGINLQPCIISLGHGSLRVFWIARRDNSWLLITRSFHGREVGPEVVIASNDEGLFRPRAVLSVSGQCFVAAESIESGRSEIALYKQTGQSWSGVECGTSDGDCFRPQVCNGPNDSLWLSFDQYVNCNYQVVVRSLGGNSSAPNEDLIISDAYSQCLHSSIATDPNGHLWIAYASNKNEASKDPSWLTKWSYVQRYDGQTLTVPAAIRSDVDVYNEHAFQGFEFPSVGVLSSGRVFLVGQSAHSILAQSLANEIWSPLHTIVDRMWGSWKPQCRISGNDVLHIASMGLNGIQVQRITPVGQTKSTPATVPEQLKSGEAGIKGTSEAPAKHPTIASPDGILSIFFGDLHGHSIYSDATGDVDEFYNRYRDWYGYDFAALTDHDYLDGIELSRSELELLWSHARRMSVDDSFIAWFGYEWTSPAIPVHAADTDPVGEGHRHVLYPSEDGPLISYGRPDSKTGRALLEKLRGVRALVIPHHTSWSGTDWDAHDPNLQRVVEIVSTHGRFEYPGNKPIGYRRDHIHPNKFVEDALARGYKLGFVGGSDSHGLRWHAIELEGRANHIQSGTRVGWKQDAYRTGMTAVLSKSLDRESLFQAIYERRCYATSGVPIVLDFRINGELMGSDISITGAPLINVSVTGTCGLRSIEVVRSGHVFGGIHFLPGQAIATSTFELIDETIIPGESIYYYVRVIQEDGNMAWSSPIWVAYE